MDTRMKTIGLIGGMSWESTTLYYQIINREVAKRLGGLRSAKLNLVSLDFADIAQRQRAGDWEGMALVLSEAARQLEATGAQCLLIGTNTMHLLAEQVQAATDVPLIHIAEVTADAIEAQRLDTVALLGTRFTMEQPFYIAHLARRGIRCLVPEEAERIEIHRIIFEELCLGQISETSRVWLTQCIAKLKTRGAQGVVLGCTELPLIVRPIDSVLPTFDTTALHALAAVEFSLSQ